MGLRLLRECALILLATAPLLAPISDMSAQARFGSDSATRLTRLGRAFAYGTIIGVAFATVDQWQNDPPEWGRGWRGYGKRTASDLSEFYIQEGVSEGLAAAMNRPLDYPRCTCREFGDRLWWAVQAGVTDQMPGGKRLFAVPRVVGAYVGSTAQAMWRPPGRAAV